MIEYLTKMGIDPEQAERYAPVGVGAIGGLVGLIVLRFVLLMTVRGVRKVRAWQAAPAAPPEQGSDEWLVGELLRLLDPASAEVTWSVYGSQLETKLPDGSAVHVRPTDYPLWGNHTDVTVYPTNGATLDRDLFSRKLRRAAKRLVTEITRKKNEAEAAKFGELMKSILTPLTTSSWRLAYKRTGSADEYVTAPDDYTLATDVVGWAYETTAARGGAAHCVRTVLERVSRGTPVAVAAWNWDPRHGAWLLDETATTMDYPGLTGPGVFWTAGAAPSGKFDTAVNEGRAAAKRAGMTGQVREVVNRTSEGDVVCGKIIV